MESNADVLALTETWLSDQDKDQFFIFGLTFPEYDFVNKTRPSSTGYGGVGRLSKSGLKMSPWPTVVYTSFELHQARFHVGSRNLDISVLYRPPPS